MSFIVLPIIISIVSELVYQRRIEGIEMNWYSGVILAVGVLGIINFIIDYRNKELNWYKYILLMISIMFITESLLYIFYPDLLYMIFK